MSSLRSPLPLLVTLLLPLCSATLGACRCAEPPPPCRSAGAARTLSSPGNAPGLLAAAPLGEGALLAWIDEGGKAGAHVVLQRLGDDGASLGEATVLGEDGPRSLLVSVATRGEEVAVVWMAGQPDKARVRGALLRGKGAPELLEIGAEGAVTDPFVAYVGEVPWALWSVGGSVWARPVAAGAPEALQLVPQKQDAFWPQLISRGGEVVLTYVTGGASYDLRLARARSVAALAGAPSRRVPQKSNIRRLEPSLAAGPRGPIIAWSQVLPPKDEKGQPTPNHLRGAILGADDKLDYLEGTFAGLGPAVAAAGGDKEGAVLAWLRPVTTETAKVAVGRLSPGGQGPWMFVLGNADLRQGRPALVPVKGGHLVAWVRAAPPPRTRELRLVKIRCQQ